MATVSPKKLELHVLDDSVTPCTVRKVCEYELPSPFAFAELMFAGASRHARVTPTPSFATLRILLSSTNEVYLFEVIVPRLEDIHFREIWRYEDQAIYDVFRPRFGVRPSTIAWFAGTWLPRPMPDSDPVIYMTASLPLGAPLAEMDHPAPKPKAHTFLNSDTLALWGLAVHDHDETRGMTVFGNAFGELVLHDFSGSDPTALADCLVDLTFPDIGSAASTRMPTVSSSLIITTPHIV